MPRPTAHKRPQKLIGKSGALDLEQGAGQELPGDETKPLEKTDDPPHTLHQRPSTGRTTALGRKVEKPAPEKQGGPSGQKDHSQHDRKHTNK